MNLNEKTKPPLKQRNYFKIIRPILGILVTLFLIWRLYLVFIVQHQYGPETWTRLLISGLIIGGVYSLIAIGYTLVYGVLLMINFAHGEVMMIGTFAGFFVFEATKSISVPSAGNPELVFSNAYPALSILIAFIIGMAIAAATGYFLEKIAYRPLRKAPRLIPLISAIGASIFLQNAALLIFSPQTRNYTNPEALSRGDGWKILINGSDVTLPYTGVFTFILSILLMVGLLFVVQKTRLGKSMRAVAIAALMGIDVNQTISNTFIISGALAGAAGVMWGLHNGMFHYFVGFLPGIKAFTAAVLGGIGNIPGAMLGGMLLGMIESIGPTALDISYQLKDVVAFVILIVILIFRPSGILGEVLAEEKV
jgi:branched-chain amino acid transport system permease protein